MLIFPGAEYYSVKNNENIWGGKKQASNTSLFLVLACMFCFWGFFLLLL